RSWRPAPRVQSRGGSLQSPAIRTLVIVLLAVGVVFGAVEVGVTAAAARLGSTAAAGPLLAAWGVGSLIGGIAASRLGGGARSAGPAAVFACAGAAGALAVLVLVLRSRTLAGRGGTATVPAPTAIVRDDQICTATARKRSPALDAGASVAADDTKRRRARRHRRC